MQLVKSLLVVAGPATQHPAETNPELATGIAAIQEWQVERSHNQFLRQAVQGLTSTCETRFPHHSRSVDQINETCDVGYELTIDLNSPNLGGNDGLADEIHISVLSDDIENALELKFATNEHLFAAHNSPVNSLQQVGSNDAH